MVDAGNNGAKTSSGYIPDGYTRDFYIRAHPEGLYPEVRGKYRPILIQTQAGIQAQIDRAGDDTDKQNEIAAVWMSKKIVEWDLKKPQGEPVDHTSTEELLHVEPALFLRLWALIMGQRGSDSQNVEFGGRVQQAGTIAGESIPNAADRELAEAKN